MGREYVVRMTLPKNVPLNVLDASRPYVIKCTLPPALNVYAGGGLAGGEDSVGIMNYVHADGSMERTPVRLRPDFDIVTFTFFDMYIRPLLFEFDAEVTVRAAGIVTGGEDNTAICTPLAD